MPRRENTRPCSSFLSVLPSAVHHHHHHYTPLHHHHGRRTPSTWGTTGATASASNRSTAARSSVLVNPCRTPVEPCQPRANTCAKPRQAWHDSMAAPLPRVWTHSTASAAKAIISSFPKRGNCASRSSKLLKGIGLLGGIANPALVRPL